MKSLKYHTSLKKTVALFIICIKCKNKNEKILKKEESIEILKILGLINIIEKYQKMHNHA